MNDYKLKIAALVTFVASIAGILGIEVSADLVDTVTQQIILGVESVLIGTASISAAVAAILQWFKKE